MNLHTQPSAVRAIAIAQAHVAWCLQDGMSTTDIAWSIGHRTSYPTEAQCIRWVAKAWLELRAMNEMRAAA